MSDMLPDPIFLSAPKAATLCGVSRNTLCAWIRNGKMEAYRTAGGKYLIRPQQLKDFMEANNMFVPPSLTQLVIKDNLTVSGMGVNETETNARKHRALVVDDEPSARKLAVSALSKVDIESVEAEDGFEALHILVKDENFHVVLLDLVMPGRNGVQVFKDIRNMRPELPVIFVTAFPPAGEEILEEPDLVITKPYSPKYLCNAVLSCVLEK